MKWGISMLKWSDIFRKIGFYCLWFSDNHKNWWGGPQDLHQWLQNTVAASKERKLLYSSGIHQKGWFWLLLPVGGYKAEIIELFWILNYEMFAKGLAEEPCSLLLIFLPYLHVSHRTWCKNMPFFRVQVLPCLRVVFIYYPFGFPFSQIVSLRSHGSIFWTNPSWLAEKYIFLTWFAIFAYFWPLLNKKCKKI